MNAIAEALANAIGADRVAIDAEALAARRYDQWAVKHLRDWRGEAVPAPGCVVRPRSVEEVQKIVRIAAERRVPLIPYGLGSGVCGGIEPTPDAILLDWQMPRMGGIEFLKLLRAYVGGSMPKVVYCITESDIGQLALAKKAGANDFMMKPFDRDILEGCFDSLFATELERQAS